MKRTILIWVLAVIVIATCTALQYKPFGTFDYTMVDVREVSLNKHLYVVASIRSEGGVSIIHSEVCPCKNKNK